MTGKDDLFLIFSELIMVKFVKDFVEVSGVLIDNIT